VEVKYLVEPPDQKSSLLKEYKGLTIQEKYDQLKPDFIEVPKDEIRMKRKIRKDYIFFQNTNGVEQKLWKRSKNCLTYIDYISRQLR